eukprot:2383896-Pleurochrysis_carterae.AAC.1
MYGGMTQAHVKAHKAQRAQEQGYSDMDATARTRHAGKTAHTSPSNAAKYFMGALLTSSRRWLGIPSGGLKGRAHWSRHQALS